MFYSPDDLVTLGIAQKEPSGSITITDFEAFEALPFNRMMTVVRDAYLKVSNFPVGKILDQSQVQEILSLWFSCTRSVPASDPQFKDLGHLKKDHATLGILRPDGELDENRIEKIAKQIWVNPNEFPSFDALLKSKD